VSSPCRIWYLCWNLTNLKNPAFVTLPRYWVPDANVSAALQQRWDLGWLLGWRDVTDARASARTTIACVIPRAAVNDKFLLMMGSNPDLALIYPVLLSFVFDYVSRQKVAGLALKYFTMRQLPVFSPEGFSSPCLWQSGMGTVRDWTISRMLELTYTAWDLKDFAKDCGCDGPPFQWNDDRRFLLRCELDAALFHLYLGPVQEWAGQPTALRETFPNPRDAVSYIMGTFPIVKKRDEQEHGGKYRTKDTILEIYDEMGEAARTGVQYQTRLNPPPADPSVAHSAVSLPVLGCLD
jgi:hypothetical protein